MLASTCIDTYTAILTWPHYTWLTCTFTILRPPASQWVCLLFAPTVVQWFQRWVSWNSLFAVVLGSQKVPIGYPIYFWDGEEQGIYITDTSLYIHPFCCFKTGALGLFALRGLWAGPFWRSTLRSDPGWKEPAESVQHLFSFSRPPVI